MMVAHFTQRSASLRLWATWLVTLFCSSHLSAQFSSYSVEKYGQSIDQNFHSVRSMCQDSLGRLYLDNFVYDGHSFALHDSFTSWRIHTDGPDNFYGRLNVYDWIYVEEGKVLDTLRTNQQSMYPTTGVLGTMQRFGDTLYVVKSEGLLIYAVEDGKHRLLDYINTETADIRNFYRGRDTLFFKHVGQSFYVTGSDPTQKVFYGRETVAHLPTFYLPNDRILLRGGKEMILSKDHPWYQVIMQFDDTNIWTTLIDSRDRLWLAISDDPLHGIYYCEANSSELHHIPYDFDPYYGVEQLYEDKRTGSIWVGTSGHGLYQIYEDGVQTLDKASGLPTDIIYAAQQNRRGEVLLSNNTRYVEILHSSEDRKRLQAYSGFHSIFVDSKDQLWTVADGHLGAQGVGLQVFQDGQVVQQFDLTDGLYDRHVLSLFEDHQGGIWCGTRKTLHHLRGDNFVQYPVPGSGEFDFVYNIIEPKDGQLLVASMPGRLFLFENGSYTEIDFPYSRAMRLLKDNRNNVWIATEEDGLLQYKDGSVHQCPDLSIGLQQLEDDQQGRIWGITTDNRILSVPIDDLEKNESNKDVHYYDSRHGVPLIDLNTTYQPTSTLLSNGKVILPNIFGAICIDPSVLQRQLPTFTTQIHHEDSEVLAHHMDLGEGVNNVSLHLKAVSLLPNQAVHHQYRLGPDEVWLDVPANGSLDLFNLSPRLSRVQHRSRYVNHEWQDPRSLDIYVAPLLHQRYGVRLLILVFVLGFISLIFRWRTRSIKQRNLHLQKVVDEQTDQLKEEKRQLSVALGEQKKLTTRLRLTQQAKNRMYAHISHEFRSPLQVVKSYLASPTHSANEEKKASVLGNINSLIEVSDEILELSRAESGHLKAFKKWYNINSLIEDQITLKSPLAEAQGIKVIFENSAVRILVYVDLSLLQKAVSNLLSNAIKFSPAQSIITITSHLQENEYHFSIMDQGIGIPTEEVDELTTTYYQATNNDVGGTGIGLSLVKEILKLHDSSLEVESELDRGSTFSFVMPIPARDDSSVSASMEIPPLAAQLKTIINPEKSIIFCVDDNPEVLKFFRFTLEPEYYVIAFSSGPDLLQALDLAHPHLILSDVNMPEMDGIELLKSLRKSSKHRTTPIILLTGSSSEETRVLALKVGANGIIQKPIDHEFLRSAIMRALRQNKAIRSEASGRVNQQLLPKHLSQDDEQLLTQLDQIILDNLQNAKLKSADIADVMGVGEKTLRKKVKTLTGSTIKEYLKAARLEKARTLVEEGYGTYSEVAAAVGFSSLSYFRKEYKKHFGED